MAWTNNTFAFGSVLTSTKMGLIQDNFAAIATGATGAPKIQTAAIDSGTLINGVYISLGANLNGTSVAVGSGTLSSTTGGYGNTGVGYFALASTTSGHSNTGAGYGALRNNVIGIENTANGSFALYSNTSGSYNTANGYSALTSNTTGQNNVADGNLTLYSNTSGSYNAAVGDSALYFNITGYNNTAIGAYALYNVASYYNCTGVGNSADVTGSNQVQLGDSSTTTYVYGTVQNRSDARDKIEIGDTIFGLEFVKRLRPRDFRWNYREDYKEHVDGEIITNADGSITREPPTIIEHPNDGSKARKRKHHGLIAQELKQVLDEMGVDFGGYQDHSVAGGQDVLSIGYDELIAPMIRAIQELAAKVEYLETKLNGT